MRWWPSIHHKGGEGMDIPRFLKIKGILMSDDGGDTWFVSRFDYLTGSDSEHGSKEFIEVPEEWKSCQLVLKRES